MGLFTPEISNMQLQFVRMTLNQLYDSGKLVNTTIKPDVFFKRLNFTLDLLLRLQPYEKYKIFKTGTPTQDYNRIVSNLEATVDDFIDRAFEANQREIATLKKASAKERCYDNFVVSLISAFDCAHTFWAGDKGFPHYDGPLFTQKNYQRVKAIFDSPTVGVGTPETSEKITSKAQSPSAESYQEMRDFEAQWFESHYDLNTIQGVKRIPAKKGLRCPQTSGVTGQLYYYLRRKAYEHEKAGKMDLAVACMSKSSELAMLDYGSMIQKQELYPLVKILARNGQVEEAIAEKEFVDNYCKEQQAKLEKEIFCRVIADAKQLGTDLVIMSVIGSTCPECAKYQGRVYSLSGNSRKYPKLPDFFYNTGRVHQGCGHSFYPFVEGVNEPMMEHILSVHPLKNKWYGRNIVAFSNRPFVDDRTEAVKAQANAYIAEQAAKAAQEKQNDDNMIAYETQRGNDMRDYFWLKENIPQKCPKSVTGYRRMKTQNTKNYQALKQLAAEHGREI